MNNEVVRLQKQRRARRLVAIVVLLIVYVVVPALMNASAPLSSEVPSSSIDIQQKIDKKEYTLATEALGSLAVKEAVSGNDYDRSSFATKWGVIDGCDVRNRILARDLQSVIVDNDNCTVLSGVLDLNHFGNEVIEFSRGSETSSDIHIEHLVAVSDAWRKGAQLLSASEREQFYNDPLNLLAVDEPTNIQKGDKDAATWLPDTSYRCRYIARQIAVKQKYNLWITPVEKQAMHDTLSTCPMQVLPIHKQTP